jgi:hypothetical protein
MKQNFSRVVSESFFDEAVMLKPPVETEKIEAVN